MHASHATRNPNRNNIINGVEHRQIETMWLTRQRVTFVNVILCDSAPRTISFERYLRNFVVLHQND